MKVFGALQPGATTVAVPTNNKVVSRYHLSEPGNFLKLSAYLDADIHDQPLRGVIYSAAGALLCDTHETVVPGGSPPQWYDFVCADSGGEPLVAGDYDLGLIGGPTDTPVSLYADAGGTGQQNTADIYADGSSDPFGSSVAWNYSASIFATYFSTWVHAEMDEMQYARLPFFDAQRVLSETPPDKDPTRSTVCGWHGTLLDPERGSFCIVQQDGPLGDLVGERLLFTRTDLSTPRSVVAFCHNLSSELLDPVSLTRRLFLALAEPAVDTIQVKVQVLS